MRNVDINNQVNGLLFDELEVAAMIHFLDQLPHLATVPIGDLGLAFLDESVMCSLHAEFLDDASPTDVITFEGDVEEGFGGEICVCPQVAWRSAQSLGEALSREICLYLVHGWLHLAGLDDLDEVNVPAMRAAERACLDALAAAGRMPAFALSEELLAHWSCSVSTV